MERFVDEAFLQRLANLRFIVKGRRKGHLSGIHVSPRSGMSLEFADYRQYAPGDDFRYIDWNIYGRLDRILVKTFVHETDLPVYVLVDLSASMQLGSPSKAHYAARLSAALAYLGLRSLERVGLYPYSDDLSATVPPRHGMAHFGRILRALGEVEPGGRTSFDTAARGFLNQTRESGLVFVISDFLTSESYQDAFARLLHRGDEVVVVQVLHPEEIAPTASGTTRLVDVETGQRLTLAIGRRTLAEYEQRLRDLRTALRTFLTERGIPYFLASTDQPLERLIHETFRLGGVIQ
ncbi:DUF58 domain-containing protein [Candidatus Bipolaricaulota bacterium]|nr:DUF58 domain-containing protein [Candidatus Bipolaricaulota bacterium]